MPSMRCTPSGGSSPNGYRHLKLRCFDLEMSTDSWDEDNRYTVEYFARKIAEHGVSSRALDWSGPESQRLRFSMLTEIGLRSGHSVLDVGCGEGDLLAWLREQSIAVDYTGLVRVM